MFCGSRSKLSSWYLCILNDCRVQNAAVRLASGDVIRFGFGILLKMTTTVKEVCGQSSPNYKCPNMTVVDSD